jgi:MFS superfamily sulfate permease-like transporter
MMWRESFRGPLVKLSDIASRGDIAAGLTLAAIGIPEQMATAQLAGLTPGIGLVAFVTATIGFAAVGYRRVISIGADSTIAPILAAGLALVAAAGSPAYSVLASIAAVAVGLVLILCGRFGLGWIADLFSIPVTTGFLTGVAVHIVLLQLPALLGLPAEHGPILDRVSELAKDVGKTNVYAAGAGVAVLAIAMVTEFWSKRLPGALIGLLIASLGVAFLGARAHGVAVIGEVHLQMPAFAMPSLGFEASAQLLLLVLVLPIVIMLQTAATMRSFSPESSLSDISRSFVGVGAANLFAGLGGSFPVNASPPRTAVMTETGATSQATSLVAALIAVALALFGGVLLGRVPTAALAGLLLFVAIRIVRVQVMLSVFRQTRSEFLLIIGTVFAIIVLPLPTGIGVGIVLSLLHGMWTTSRAQIVEFVRLPGTSVWWAPTRAQKGEKLEGVMVLAYQAPLSFLNAFEFRRGVENAIAKSARPVRAVVLEANGIAEIDYTAAQTLSGLIDWCRAARISLAIARLESLRAQEALERFHVVEHLGRDRLFLTVEDAVRALALH